ncbi:MAG: tRNA (guanosine(46)-N7)-methyltransferase TrmB [Thermotogota bacterium]|nr:tRNA (guanosine(46)-N7)-methyltransferase TrmB [Thermotogota bacterium]
MDIKYFIDPRYTKIPLELHTIFPEQTQFFSEIGFGNGEFLIEKALLNPETAFIGIELSLTSVTKLLKKIKDLRIDNIIVIMCDAKFAIRELFDENLNGIYMNFPCPWPKKRHRQRRLNNTSFIESFVAALKSYGFISIYSDHANFIKQFEVSLKENGCFSHINLDLNPPTINTKYEIKWREQRKDIYHLYAVKEKNKDILKIAGGEDMPHVHLEKINNDQLQNVIGKTFGEGTIFFKYVELFHSTQKNKYIIQTITVDNDFEQRFFIEIRQKDSNNWIISLDSNGLPFRTPSVKRAVFYLGEVQK